MSGRQAKVLQEQAARYGIPFGGSTIDLPEVVRALHDFLANAKYQLRGVKATAGAAASARRLAEFRWTWRRVADDLIVWWGEIPHEITVGDLQWLSDSYNAVLDHVINLTGPLDPANKKQTELLTNGLGSATAALMQKRFGKDPAQWPIPEKEITDGY